MNRKWMTLVAVIGMVTVAGCDAAKERVAQVVNKVRPGTMQTATKAPADTSHPVAAGANAGASQTGQTGTKSAPAGAARSSLSPTQPKDSAAALREIEQYVLNDEDMNKFETANKNLKAVVAAHPNLKTAAKIDLQRMDSAQARFGRTPLLKKALSDAGLTPYQYFTISTIAFISGLATLDPDTVKTKKGLKDSHINPLNLSYVLKRGSAGPAGADQRTQAPPPPTRNAPPPATKVATAPTTAPSKSPTPGGPSTSASPRLVMQSPRPTAARTVVAVPPRLSADAEAALNDLSSQYAMEFDLHPGWFRDRPISYYDFGVTPQPTQVGRVLWPIYGFDARGNPVAITGQRPIFSSIPGVSPYSGFWRLTYVVTADHVRPNDLRDEAAVDALIRQHRANVRMVDGVMNLPIVPRGSHLVGDSTPPSYGWYAGREIQYFDFGRASVAPVPLFVFTRGTDSTGAPAFLREQSNVADTIPVRGPFPDLWSIQFVQVDSTYPPNKWRNASAVVGGGASITSAHSLRNCPIVTVNGARIARDASPLRVFADDRSPLPPSPTIVP